MLCGDKHVHGELVKILKPLGCVIPGRASARAMMCNCTSGIHLSAQPEARWIPGSMLRIAPE